MKRKILCYSHVAQKELSAWNVGIVKLFSHQILAFTEILVLEEKSTHLLLQMKPPSSRHVQGPQRHQYLTPHYFVN